MSAVRSPEAIKILSLGTNDGEKPAASSRLFYCVPIPSVDMTDFIAYYMLYTWRDVMGTTKTASARALIDPQIKKEAEAILKELGLSVSKSFELYYRQIIAHRGLPFELKIPNEKTMKAIENSRQGKGKTFTSTEELFDDLGI
jgi:DNA-damage-inducible protein J